MRQPEGVLERRVTLTRGCLLVTLEGDMDLPARVTKWELVNGIFSIRGTSFGGMGKFGATYRPEDVDQVLEFVRAEFPEYEIP